MENSHKPTVSMTVDLKKYRIRIHKASLHFMGDPSYIQLLVNPETRVVAFRAVQLGDEHAHRVNQRLIRSDNSYEIYSYSFIRKLKELVDGLTVGNSYRLTGSIYQADRTAVFPLDSIQRVET